MLTINALNIVSLLIIAKSVYVFTLLKCSYYVDKEKNLYIPIAYVRTFYILNNTHCYTFFIFYVHLFFVLDSKQRLQVK